MAGVKGKKWTRKQVVELGRDFLREKERKEKETRRSLTEIEERKIRAQIYEKFLTTTK